jgi:hypothetical protein
MKMNMISNRQNAKAAKKGGSLRKTPGVPGASAVAVFLAGGS